MVTKYILVAAFVLCNISRAYNEALNGFTSKYSNYTVVYPKVIHRQTRNANSSQESEEMDEKDTISYTLNINNRQHILHLKRNRDFLPESFVQYSHYKNGSYKSSLPKHRVHCYYHGQVDGLDQSLVALSTCAGLRGVIFFDDVTYGLEPVPQSPANEHLLYLLKDIHSEPSVCGVVSETSTESYEPFHPGHSITSLLRRKRNLPQTNYVELAFVVDNLRYNLMKKNDKAILDQMVEMANLLDGYYKQLNVRVALVGLEIFKDANPFSVNRSAGEVLVSFVQWRQASLLPRVKNDMAQLIVGQNTSYPGGVLGMAFVGTVCSESTSGGITVFSDNSVAYISTVVAHEMGHNLGMIHDTTSCICNASSCIMNAAATGVTYFSNCSGANFVSLIQRGGGVCLRNQPTTVISIPVCGNGILEDPEQCDCGTPQTCTNKCCNPATCTFTAGAVCAQGTCCNSKCQLKVSGKPCRDSINACDLPEYCTGGSAFCPQNYFVMDGLTCENNAAYCFEGSCQTYDFQCQKLFAPGAKKAADICFQTANTKGNAFGNCGITSSGTYTPCSIANVMCGKVQCSNVDVNHPPPGVHVSNQIIDGSQCVNADFDLGTDVVDPAHVKPGSPCSQGKTCINFACVNASVLLPNLTCNAQSTCNSRGVCNNLGHCHCINGWGPPYCDKSGRGGSVDSGPAEIDYSLRNGLLIFFLLVLPVLAVIVFLLLYVFRREAIEPCLKRCAQRNRSRNPQNKRTNAAATAQPSQAPPAKPPNPTVIPPSNPGNRGGDYWETNIITASGPRPPAPQQGPGVPRPIPS